MLPNVTLPTPFFEIGLKAYVYGNEALDLALFADNLTQQYGVQIIFTPQYVDIPSIATQCKNLAVFAQHIDAIGIGKGNGAVLADAVSAAGACGTFLNHAEKPLALHEIAQAIRRTEQAGLMSMVCADSPEEGAAMAHLEPDIILVEPRELIGSGTSVSQDDTGAISEAVETIQNITPAIQVLNSAGIKSGSDVADVIRGGAHATGVSSGVLKAEDPKAKMEEMIKALREAWDETRGK